MNLIDKNALVAEITKRKNRNVFNKGAFEEDIDILSFLDTLEVKEVDLGNEFDLNKEIDEQIRLLGGVHKLDNNSKRWYTGPYEELFHFARHFFELGMQESKNDSKHERR